MVQYCHTKNYCIKSQHQTTADQLTGDCHTKNYCVKSQYKIQRGLVVLGGGAGKDSADGERRFDFIGGIGIDGVGSLLLALRRQDYLGVITDLVYLRSKIS